MKRLTLRRFHRFHALFMTIIVLMAALSGMLHTAMTWLQSPPPRPGPLTALDLSQLTVGIDQVRTALPSNTGKVLGLSIRPIGDLPFWQVMVSSQPQPLYVNATTGELDTTADSRYAQEIASKHLGLSSVEMTDWITAFDNEYIFIYRILPVYRFDAKDEAGNRVYVSTMTGSVTRHTDDLKQLESASFTYLHKWAFIGNKTVRDVMMVVANLSLVALAFSGVVLFWRTRRRPTDTRVDSSP